MSDDEEPELPSGGITQKAHRARNLDTWQSSPVDNAIINLFAPIATWCARHGVTPNHLSIAGAILGGLSLVALWKGYLVAFVCLFALSYCTDALDGWMARTFQLYSEWGEALDHGKDIILTLALVVVVLWKRRPPWLVLVALCIGYLIALVGEACLQSTIEERKSQQGIKSENSLQEMAGLCPKGYNPAVTRWIATPTYLAVVGACICVFAGARSLFAR